jgi:outer membrane protein assembly factor BamB
MPENDPGRQVVLPLFAEVLAQHDANKDGRLSKDELPDERTKMFFPYLDLNHDGALDEEEWNVYRLLLSAENGLLAIQPGNGRGDLTRTAIRWAYRKAIPQLPSMVLYRGVLYMINDSGVLTTLNPSTGEVLKQARLRGAADKFFASPVAADGKIFFVSLNGTITVLEAGADQKVIASNELDDEVYATPAIVDGRIYLRSRGALWCFGKS